MFRSINIPQIITQSMVLGKWRKSPKHMLYENTPIAQKQPQVLFYLEQWEWMSKYLRITHVGLGLSATFFSLLAASQIGSIPNEFITVFAFIAALCIGLLTAFNLNTKSNNMRTAWRRLNSSALMYNSGKINDEELISEYKTAESTIGDVTYSGNS